MWRASKNQKVLEYAKGIQGSAEGRFLKAFTLVELIIITAIILVLALIAYTQIEQKSTARGRDVRRVSEVNTLRTALQLYFMDYGKYPVSTVSEDEYCSVEEGGCPNLTSKLEPYLRQMPNDPLFGKGREPAGTGRLYSYQYISTSSGQGYKIYSDLETREAYEVSGGGYAIAYIPSPLPQPYCGDGTRDPDEACDDGVDDNGNCSLYPGGCNASCDDTMICGNNTVECGEECEPPEPGCGSDCKWSMINVYFNPSSYSEAEDSGIPVEIIVELSKTSEDDVTVDYEAVGGTATDTQDYTFTPGSLTIFAGDATSSFTVNITNDSIYEGDEETAIFEITGATNADIGSPHQAILTILDDDLPKLSFNPTSYERTEGPGVTVDIFVQLSPAIGEDVTVYYRVDPADPGIAIEGLDYTDGSGILTFASGETQQSFLITIIDDDEVEGDEFANFEIYSPSLNATIGPDNLATLTIYGGVFEISKAGDASKFDSNFSEYPAISQIDSLHYLVVYQRSGGWSTGGRSVVLEVNTSTGAITTKSSLRFDSDSCAFPAISQIDTSHYLVAYTGSGSYGYAVVLEVNTSDWSITKKTSFEFDSDYCYFSAISQIDTEHYLVPYMGPGAYGYAVVLKVDTSNWTITKKASFEFDPTLGVTPAISQIDTEHYLVTYAGYMGHGYAVVFNATTTGTDWEITTSSAAFKFDPSNLASFPAISQIDTEHYLVPYRGLDTNGWAVVLNVTASNGDWTISFSSANFEFNPDTVSWLDVAQIDTEHYLVPYSEPSAYGYAVVLNAATSNGDWTITTSSAPFVFDPNVAGYYLAISQIDPTHYLITYTGPDEDGWAVVLEVTQ